MLKRNLLVVAFDPVMLGISTVPILSPAAFGRAVQDYLVFGNAHVEHRDVVIGRVLGLDHSLAKYTRRGLVDGEFFWTPGPRGRRSNGAA